MVNKETLAQDVIKASSEAFTEQLMKMTKNKIIAPYPTLEYSRLVIDLYKKAVGGNKPSEAELTEAQNKLNLAIDHAKVNDLPFDDLDALKRDVDYLKYELEK